jgi:hypothetical protein
MKQILLILTLINIPLSHAAVWPGHSNPYIIGKHFKVDLEQLPLSGKLSDSRLGWPGNHWPNYKGGIASRWSAGNPQNFSYKFMGPEELKKLEPHELRELSPAEKFDILNNDYTYSTVRRVFRSVSPRENEWHGICHGFAPASIHHPEPMSVELTNDAGITVQFYSSDVAALLSYYYAKVVSTPVQFIGKRCNYRENNVPRRAKSACDGMNAGAFHVVLTNKLGLDGVGFVVDIDRYSEVWNHVAVDYHTYDYAFSEPVATSAPGTVKRLQVETIVTYASEIAPKFGPVLGTENAVYLQNTYEYYLDLDQDNRVIGGDWIGEKRPDFVWTQDKASFNGKWSLINKIYQPGL